MRTLYHYPLCPFSRKVRVFMKEKHLEFELVIESFWEKRREFLVMNPAGQVPVLKEASGRAFSDSGAICEYIEETCKDVPLIGGNAAQRAEARRVAAWFDTKFYHEVSKYLLAEKLFKFLKHEGAPRSDYIRAGKENIKYHLDYIAFLRKKHRCLAGDEFTLADITAAAHLSVIDYLGDVPWHLNEDAKEWYMLVKSRPSFRPLLQDRLGGFPPSSQYDNLDF